MEAKVNKSFNLGVSLDDVERETQKFVNKGGTLGMAKHFQALVGQLKIKVKRTKAAKG